MELFTTTRLVESSFRRQYVIGRYVVDFCSLRRKLVIELDGSPHLEQKEADTERTGYLESRGLPSFAVLE